MSYLIPCSSPDVTKKNDPPTFCKESHKLEESEYVFNTRPAATRLTIHFFAFLDAVASLVLAPVSHSLMCQHLSDYFR